MYQFQQGFQGFIGKVIDIVNDRIFPKIINTEKITYRTLLEGRGAMVQCLHIPQLHTKVLTQNDFFSNFRKNSIFSEAK